MRLNPYRNYIYVKRPPRTAIRTDSIKLGYTHLISIIFLYVVLMNVRMPSQSNSVSIHIKRDGKNDRLQ